MFMNEDADEDGVVIDFSDFRLFRLLLYVEPPSLRLVPFCVSGRGSGGDGASGGGLGVEDVLVDGGDGWWLKCSKSITREIEKDCPPPTKKVTG